MRLLFRSFVAARLVAAAATVCFAPLPAVAASTPASIVTTLGEAQAAYDRSDYRSAAKLYEDVVRLNPVNPAYWHALAESYYRAGEFAASIPAYEKSLAMRARQPSTAAYELARAYARAGDKVRGMRWLRQSMDWGYPHLDDARKDKDLDALRSDPRFNDALGIVDASKMTRAQGWRYDLDFIARWTLAKAYHPFRSDAGDRFVSGAQLTERQFQSELAGLKKRVPGMTNVQIELALMRLFKKFGDGHTEVAVGPGPEYRLTLPLKFELFKEGMFITAADPDHKALLGGQVLSMDGHPVAQVLNVLSPYLSRDNDQWIEAFAPVLLRYTAMLQGLGITQKGDRMTLDLRARDSSTQKVTVVSNEAVPYLWNMLPSPKGWVNLFDTLSGTPPLYLQKNDECYWFQYDSGGKVLYFQFNRVLDCPGESLSQFTNRLQEFTTSHAVDKMIVDMRWNNGGNTYLSRPLLDALRNREINRRGHLFVIIGPRTFSAALNTVAHISQELNAIFIGEPTGGKPNSPGDEWFVTLPYSKVVVNFSNVYWESGGPFDDRWSIPPDIFTPRTFADYLAGRDPALDAALEYRN